MHTPYTPLEEDDIQEKTLANYSLEELEKHWMARMNNTKVVFISAENKENVEEFKSVLYEEVKSIFQERYPYHNFLY